MSDSGKNLQDCKHENLKATCLECRIDELTRQLAAVTRERDEDREANLAMIDRLMQNVAGRVEQLANLQSRHAALAEAARELSHAVKNLNDRIAKIKS